MDSSSSVVPQKKTDFLYFLIEIFMKCQTTYYVLTVPWGDVSDQDSLCLCIMYNYEMLSAMNGKDAIRAHRKGRILCLQRRGMAFRGKDET